MNRILSFILGLLALSAFADAPLPEAVFPKVAANRLLLMGSNTNTHSRPRHSLKFSYDWQGRRIQKEVFFSNPSTLNYELSTRTKFVYGGWNLIAELNATNNSVIRSYVWGLDLSGTLQGAGGVGGLLAVNDTTDGVHFPAFDGNGNVAAMVAAQSSTLSAVYEYGPFGELLRATGPLAKANPFRFSTKYHDEETGLLLYGHRYYDPATGRWSSRDPIEEAGGLNLYGFVGNDGVNTVDPIGLVSSLNFLPASELAWVFGSSAAIDAGLSIAMQRAGKDPCKEKWLSGSQVGKDVAIGAAMTVGTRGLSKLFDLYKAAKLARLLEKAEGLRAAGRFDDLAEMMGKYGDDFGDAFANYRRAGAAAHTGELGNSAALAAEEGLNGSLQLARGGSRSTVLAANRTLYDQFIESGGTLTRARSTAVFDAQGQQVFGRFFPESNEIMLYKGSNLGTLSEELIHFRDIQNSGLLYQKFNPNALLPSPYGGTWTLRDSLEAHAQTVLYQWGYVGKP